MARRTSSRLHPAVTAASTIPLTSGSNWRSHSADRLTSEPSAGGLSNSNPTIGAPAIDDQIKTYISAILFPLNIHASVTKHSVGIDGHGRADCTGSIARLEVLSGLLLLTLHVLDAKPGQSRKAIGISTKFAAWSGELAAHPHRKNAGQFTGPSRTEPSGTPPSIGMALRFADATIGWLTSDVTMTGLFEGTRS